MPRIRTTPLHTHNSMRLEHVITGRSRGAECTQVHASVQGYGEHGASSVVLSRCCFSSNYPEDVTSLLSVKIAVKYAQLPEIESMRAIALAHQNRNLSDFEKAPRDYKHGTLFLILQFIPEFSLPHRTLVRPYYSLAYRSAVRHSPSAESPAYC